MSSARLQPKKTFYLSDLTAVRGGRIALGNIFRDPFAVDDPSDDTLSKPTSDEDKAFLAANTQTLLSANEEVRESRSRSWSAELWAKVLEALHIEVGASSASDVSVVYEVDEMRTEWLDDGVAAYARARVARESALAAIVGGGGGGGGTPGQPRPRPVYMVAGVKYSRGLKVVVEEGAARTVGAKAAAPLTGGPDAGAAASAGAGAKAEKKVARTLARELGPEAVFAYRLVEIGHAAVRTLDQGLLSDAERAAAPGPQQPLGELGCVDFAADEGHVRRVAVAARVQPWDYALAETDAVVAIPRQEGQGGEEKGDGKAEDRGEGFSRLFYRVAS